MPSWVKNKNSTAIIFLVLLKEFMLINRPSSTQDIKILIKFICILKSVLFLLINQYTSPIQILGYSKIPCSNGLIKALFSILFIIWD